jgi:hypothetical protein
MSVGESAGTVSAVESNGESAGVSNAPSWVRLVSEHAERRAASRMAGWMRMWIVYSEVTRVPMVGGEEGEVLAS